MDCAAGANPEWREAEGRRNDMARVATPWNSLPSMLFDLARRRPERPMLRSWRDGGWRAVSWA